MDTSHKGYWTAQDVVSASQDDQIDLSRARRLVNYFGSQTVINDGNDDESDEENNSVDQNVVVMTRQDLERSLAPYDSEL